MINIITVAHIYAEFTRINLKNDNVKIFIKKKIFFLLYTNMVNRAMYISGKSLIIYKL